jgi:hypothetical protein
MTRLGLSWTQAEAGTKNQLADEAEAMLFQSLPVPPAKTPLP